MIEKINGFLLRRGTEDVSLEWNNISFKILMPPSLVSKLPECGAEVSLYTYFVIKDDLPRLYGFIRLEEKVLFETLLGVAGIGPRAAMGIIGFLPPNRFYEAIVNEEIKVLTAVPGIGQKGARRLILELKEKVSRKHLAAEGSGTDTKRDNCWEQALDALLSLGYNSQEVLPAIETVRQAAAGEDVNQEQALRLILKKIGSDR